MERRDFHYYAVTTQSCHWKYSKDALFWKFIIDENKIKRYSIVII